MKDKTLPTEWMRCPLDKVAVINMGQSPSSADVNENGEGIAFFQGKAEFGKLYPTPKKYCIAPKKVAEKDDVLLSIRAPVGPTNIANQKVAIGRGLASIRGSGGNVNSNYLLYFFRHIEPWLSQQGTGSTFKAVSGGFVKKIDFILSPFEEQKEIVARLDNVLAQVDVIKTRLDAIPAILKRFRKSVLAAAVSGKFTVECRDVSYAEWRSVKLEEVANIIDPHPSHRTPKEVPEGVPYIGIGDLNQDGSINFSGARKVSAEVLKDHNARYSLKKGDFVFGKIGTLGRATVLPTDRDYTLSANVILIQPLEGYVLPKFLMYFLSSPATMDEVTRQSNSTSQAAFGIKKMRAFNCRIPSLEEQSEIAQRVEQLLAFADQVEQRVKDSQSRVNKLTQSILAKAFRGELTADWREQHPELISAEKSAQALLEKIKIQQAELAKTSRKKRTKKS